jgi:hypothetical protein
MRAPKREELIEQIVSEESYLAGLVRGFFPPFIAYLYVAMYSDYSLEVPADYLVCTASWFTGIHVIKNLFQGLYSNADYFLDYLHTHNDMSPSISSGIDKSYNIQDR